MAVAARSALAVGALALAIGLVSPAAAPAAPAGYAETNVAVGLAEPTAIGFLPDGGLLVAEKGGALKLVRSGNVSTLRTFAVCTDKSMGLLGVLVDPAFASNGFVYVYRTRPPGSNPANCGSATDRVNEVVRIRLAGDTVVPGSEQAIFTGIRTDNGQHNGGTLRIGADGKLYVSTGDTGLGDFPAGPPGTSTNPFAQDLGELPGKILRLNLDGSPAAGNPFAATPGARPEVFAYGFRNPFRFGVDPETGRLWVGDVGQLKWEELNVVGPGRQLRLARLRGQRGQRLLPAARARRAGVRVRPERGRHARARRSPEARSRPARTGRTAASTSSATMPPTACTTRRRTPPATAWRRPPAVFVDGADGPVEIAFGPDAALYYVAIKVGQVRRVSTPSLLVHGAGRAERRQRRHAAADRDGGPRRPAPQPPLSPQPAGRPRLDQRPARRAGDDHRDGNRLDAQLDEDIPLQARAAARSHAAALGAASRSLSRGVLRKVRRAAGRRRLSKARVKVTLIDSAGNASRAQARIKLLRGALGAIRRGRLGRGLARTRTPRRSPIMSS